MIILSFLVFLHWLAQFYLDNQEKDNAEDILDSDDDGQYSSPYEKHLDVQSNRLKKKKYLKKKVLDIKKGVLDFKKGHRPSLQTLKTGSESSSVSDKSAKIRSKKRLAVSLSVFYTAENLRLAGMIKGVIGLQFPDHGGPDKIRFKLNLVPSRRRNSCKTLFHIPLDASLRIPFHFKIIKRDELAKTRIHLKLYGKTEKLGPFGPSYCYGESFISLMDLSTNVNEINIVQEIIPLGSKPFNRESIKIRISTPVITVQETHPQLPLSPEDVDLEIDDGTEAVEDRSSKYAVPDS